MNNRYSRFILPFMFFLSVIGCSDINVSNEKTDDFSKGSMLLKPPRLTIFIGKETVRPSLGNYSWSIDNGDGTESAIEADSIAPPEMVKSNDPLQVIADTNIELNFEMQPDSYTVRIWDEDNNIISTSDKVVLSSKGKIIYEILAQWKQGIVSYVFYLNVE